MQKVVRTAPTPACDWYNGSRMKYLTELLDQGYKVVMCNKIGDDLEYIVERTDEKPEGQTFEDVAKEIIYELGKELDVITKDIRDNFSSIDEAASMLASRIRTTFAYEEENEKDIRK